MPLNVTADDFGLCPQVNSAICQLHDTGVVDQASIIVNTPFFEQSIQLLKERPSLRVGIHLNLTQGAPVLGKEAVPSLVNHNGQFYGGRHYRVAFSLQGGLFNLREVHSEWRGQIKRLIDAGIEIHTLNSHGHLHLLPRAHQLVLELMKEFELQSIRLTTCSRSLKEALFCRLSKDLLRKSGKLGLKLEYPGQLLGLTYHGHFDKAKLIREVQHKSTANAELILHPSRGPNEFHQRWHYLGEQEFQMLRDPEIVKILHS